MKNYYDILGVSENATSDQIKQAFKDIAKRNIQIVAGMKQYSKKQTKLMIH